MRHGLVIRTAFNNQGWTGPCKGPKGDPRCFKCVRGDLRINDGKPITEDERGFCTGAHTNYGMGHPLDLLPEHWCWEQLLCTEQPIWGNVRGKWRSVFNGMPVYFVFRELSGTLTLWGHSKIDKIDNSLDEFPLVYIKPFKALPQSKWVTGLTGEKITGREWKQLNYRYLDQDHELYLSSLIKGERNDPYEEVNVQLRKEIKEKLQRIAGIEGREVMELVREAIARLIRDRAS